MSLRELNLAALMRQDCRTVHVVFGGAAELDTESELSTDEVRIDNAAPKVYVAEQRKANKGYAVTPDRTGRRYTYVTDMTTLAPGDTVVVPIKNTVGLAFVVEVDEDVEIEPDDNVEYRWIVAKVDTEPYRENMRRNAEINTLLAKAKKQNMRDAFREVALRSLGANGSALLGIASPKAPEKATPPEAPAGIPGDIRFD
jgi:hypothetical protein